MYMMLHVCLKGCFSIIASIFDTAGTQRPKPAKVVESDETEDRPTTEVPMEHCGCARKIEVSHNRDGIDLADTTCSTDAFQRGKGQKVKRCREN